MLPVQFALIDVLKSIGCTLLKVSDAADVGLNLALPVNVGASR
jgi:hypothetical protein